MNCLDIFDRLRILKSDIKTVVYDGLPIFKTTIFDNKLGNKIIEHLPDDWSYDVQIDNFYIKYNETETFRPSKEEIFAVTDDQVLQYRKTKKQETKQDLINQLNDLKAKIDALQG